VTVVKAVNPLILDARSATRLSSLQTLGVSNVENHFSKLGQIELEKGVLGEQYERQV